MQRPTEHGVGRQAVHERRARSNGGGGDSGLGGKESAQPFVLARRTGVDDVALDAVPLFERGNDALDVPADARRAATVAEWASVEKHPYVRVGRHAAPR